MARSRFRSVRYDLSAAIEVARVTDSAGGTIAPDLLAPALGYSGTNNGAYLSRVASARRFGVVGGRGSRVALTERGRQILAGVEPGAALARREAFLAVPLFRAVADAAGPDGGRLPRDLARWLVDDFGETEAKAQTAADQLVASGGQAGLLRRTPQGTFQLTGSFTNFTSVDNSPSLTGVAPLGLRRGARSPAREEAGMAEDGLWLDDEAGAGTRRPAPWRRAGIVGAAAAVLIVVAVPVALVAGGSSPAPSAGHDLGRHPRPGSGPAEHEVLSALSATTDSGSFDFTYAISSTPASTNSPTTTPTTVCDQIRVPVPTGTATVPRSSPAVSTGGSTGGVPVGGSTPPAGSSNGPSVGPSGGAVSGAFTPATGSLPPGLKWQTREVCHGPPPPVDPPVDGSGIIDTTPLGMVASARIGGGLDVTVRVDGSDVYEEGTGDTGLAPVATDATASGTGLPQFAGITEGTLGNRQGAVAMMGMASPTGYLDLVQPAISAATETGTGSVDGVPVTNYRVANDLSQLAGAAGTSAAEAQTITAALGVLKGQGYVSNAAVVSIDAAGFIRQVRSTDTFADGGTVTLLATFSNFGCAGTILMPGQSGTGLPPAGCVSPDGPNSPTTTTTGAAPPAIKSPTASGPPAATGNGSTTTSTTSTTAPPPSTHAPGGNGSTTTPTTAPAAPTSGG